MFNALEIANYFIKLAKKHGKHITNMQLQKFVYISHGLYLAFKNGLPLIDEFVQAWEYGPVIPSIYHAFKEYGSGPIRDYYRELIDIDEETIPMVNDSEVKQILETVWDIYSTFSAIELSSLTHEEGSPWSTTFEKSGKKILRGKSIENKTIQDYYQDKLSEID